MCFQDPVNGGQLAAAWGTRETFIAVVTTNLPMTFPLFKTWLAPVISSTIRSGSNSKALRTPGGGVVTIGGGGGGASSRNRQSAHHVTANMTFDNESEENILKGDGDVKMQHINTAGVIQQSPNSIVVSKQISITTEDCDSERSAHPFQRV
jgi:hypothetical protein